MEVELNSSTSFDVSALGGHNPAELAAMDAAHSWHPFTPMPDYLAHDQVMVARGKGVRLQDTAGRWYYDGVASIWLNVHGHSHPKLNAAITEQLDRIAHSTMLGQANVPSTILAKRLIDIAPSGLERVFFSDSGATAVEIALKIAIQYWANQGLSRKRQILGFTNNYHGDTMGAMAVAPDPIFHWAFLDLLPAQPRAPYPYWYHAPNTITTDSECMSYSLSAVEKTFAEHGGELAAVIIEPVEGAGGICPAPRGYLKALRELCDQHEILLIVDEVATGFGKTGSMFACLAESITPDLLCMGKGLTAGYLPVAATLATGAIFEKFLGERRNTLFHGHSFTGNQLGCAVALANLDLMPAVMAELPPKIDRIWERLETLRGRECIGDLRGRGFMAGIELAADPAARRGFPAEVRAAYQITDAARERGLLVRPIGNVVIFMPPLVSTIAELDAMLDILIDSFEATLPTLAQQANNINQG
jgi:adenosylmethionine---8-amino-7-oxononanoate aminotransferase